MSNFKFKVRTYAYDQTGYYIGNGDELTIEVFANDTSEARKKALDLRKGDRMRGTADTWGAVVLSAEEVEPVPNQSKEQ